MEVKSQTKLKDIKVFQSSWDESIEPLIVKLNPCLGRDLLKINVEQGNIILYSVTANNIRVGIFFVRIDRNYDGSEELAILFSVSEYKIKIPFYSLLSFAYDKISCGRDIRIHSPNRVIDKFCESNGFEYLESVYIKRY